MANTKEFKIWEIYVTFIERGIYFFKKNNTGLKQ